MSVTPFDHLDYAYKAVQFLNQDERIQLARRLCLSLGDPKCADALRVASLEILTHGDTLAADRISRRPDGTAISPYAPGGGPLAPTLAVVK